MPAMRRWRRDRPLKYTGAPHDALLPEQMRWLYFIILQEDESSLA